jgi:3-deoxy-D-manno-octulosonic-acid transferase
MMIILYRVLYALLNLILELLYYISYPVLKLIANLYQYGEAFTKADSRNDHPILIHAASVGEVNAALALIRKLLELGYPLCINTVTVTGRAAARNAFPDLDIRLAPLDVLHLRQRQMSLLKPRLILIVETEIWPNMLYAAGQKGIPIVFINARITEKSLQRYRKIRFLFPFLAPSVKAVLAQSEADKHRFEQLFEVSVKAAGNLKYCMKQKSFDEVHTRNRLGLRAADFILTWGSSRPGEEALMLQLFPEIKKQNPKLKLILAPRHPKRVPEVEKLLSGLSYIKLSEISQKQSWEILLIDTLGHLAEAYAISDLVIVGGSFYDFGGHNPLEPAYYAKAIVMGEYHSSCSDSVQQLVQRDAILISSPQKLRDDLLKLAQNPLQRKKMGQMAKLVLTDNASALDDHIRGIQLCLK